MGGSTAVEAAATDSVRNNGAAVSEPEGHPDVDALLEVLRQHAAELRPGSRVVPAALSADQRALLIGEGSDELSALSVLLKRTSTERYLEAAARREALQELSEQAGREALREQRICAFIESLQALRAF